LALPALQWRNGRCLSTASWPPPTRFIPSRATLDDIEIANTTIPKGSQVALVLAGGSRNPDHVRAPTGSTPTDSVSSATTTNTSVSAVAFTTASTHRSPGLRPRSRSASWPAGSSAPAWPQTPRPTGPTRSYPPPPSHTTTSPRPGLTSTTSSRRPRARLRLATCRSSS
jgi:hypothetical protein